MRNKVFEYHNTSESCTGMIMQTHPLLWNLCMKISTVILVIAMTYFLQELRFLGGRGLLDIESPCLYTLKKFFLSSYSFLL